LSFGMKKLQNLEFWHEKPRDLVNLEFGPNSAKKRFDLHHRGDEKKKLIGNLAVLR